MTDESTAPEDRAETMAEVIAGHGFGYYANDEEGLAHAYCSCCFWAWTHEPLDTFTRDVAALSHAEHVVDKLREIGVVEPREITTVEELDALPEMSVVLIPIPEQGGSICAQKDIAWFMPGGAGPVTIDDGALPVMVLHTSGESC